VPGKHTKPLQGRRRLQIGWQKILGLLVALLLAVPPVLLSIGSLPGSWFAEVPEPADMSPRLSWEERSRIATYDKSCRTDTDCDPPLGCFPGSIFSRQRCTDSECKTDADCAPDSVCRIFRTLGAGPRVRVCVKAGTRKEGEACSPIPTSERQACLPGLVCYGWCGRRCDPEDRSSCPQGFSCMAGLNGPACMPMCRGHTCPEGQQCIDFGHLAFCSVIYGTDCRSQGCPPGQRCDMYNNPSRHYMQIWLECVTPCSQEGPPCPGSQSCVAGACRQACEWEHRGACGPERECKYLEDKWVCAPAGGPTAMQRAKPELQ
jgi:hypothetical protein